MYGPSSSLIPVCHGVPCRVGGGDAAVLMRPRPAGEELVRFLATAEAGEIWAARGGFLSPNEDVDLSLYRSAQIGQSLPLDSTANCGAGGCVISGLSPYWRLGWEHDWSSGPVAHSLEVGTFGMVTHVYPSGVSGPTDNYTDIGVDSQYQMLWPHSSLAVHALYLHENQRLNATYAAGRPGNPNDHLNPWSLNPQYYRH